MNKFNIPLIIALILVSTFTFQIKNLKHSINVNSVLQYGKYVKTILGQFTQNDLKQNQNLKDIVQNQRLSLFNSPKQIVLVLIDQIKQNNQNKEIQKHQQNLNELINLDNLSQKFNLLNMADFDEQTINKKIQQLQSMGNIIHTLQTSSELAKSLLSINQQTKTRKLAQAKPIVKQQTGQLSTSYILKFFFILVFIFVCIGALSTIANMENKKDTLLYAKFIADIGTR